MQKYKVNDIPVEIGDNFYEVVKNGFDYYMTDDGYLDKTDTIDVIIDGHNHYYGYYRAKIPMWIEFRVFCKECESFIGAFKCNLGGELMGEGYFTTPIFRRCSC